MPPPRKKTAREAVIPASGTPMQPPVPPAQAAAARQAGPPPAQPAAVEAPSTEITPSTQHEERELLRAVIARRVYPNDEAAKSAGFFVTRTPASAFAAQFKLEPPPPLPAAPKATDSEPPSTLSAPGIPAQQEQPAASGAEKPDPQPAHPAAGSAAASSQAERFVFDASFGAARPAAGGFEAASSANHFGPAAAQAAKEAAGPSDDFRKELFDRHKKGDASTAELRKFYQDVLNGRGISGIVAEISAWEETPGVHAEAVQVVVCLIGAAKQMDFTRILTECADARLVPVMVEATSKYRHCSVLRYCAFSLFYRLCMLANMVPEADAALEPTVTHMNAELAAAADITLAYISTQQSSSTDLACETAFLFLAMLFGESMSCKAHFPEYAHQHGEHAIRQCLAVLRKSRGVSVTSNAAVETLMELVWSSDKLALYAVKLNAVDLLTTAAPIADTLLSASALSCTTLGYIARALCAILRAVSSQALVVTLASQASAAVLEVIMTALRLGVLENPSPVIEALDLVFEKCPALVFPAVRVGALDLVDVGDSTAVQEFVEQLKARVKDAEASADAAAAELLAAEDAVQARAAAKAAKPKRAKKPAAPAASANVSPSSAEHDAAGEQPPSAHLSSHTGGHELELSQSESALRRRRRAATKAVRRAAVASSVQRGGEAAAADSSDSDEHPAAAGEDASPPPASSASDAQSASSEAENSRLEEHAAAAAQPTEVVPLADIFPWMAMSDAASSPAAQLDARLPAAALQPEPAPPALKPLPLPLPSSERPPVAFERIEVLCAEPACAENELARAKDETTCAKNELVRARAALACSKDELAHAKDELACAKDELAHAKDELACARDELDASKCVICLSAPRCLAMLPCRHLPLCAAADCAAAMGAPPRCPLCRVGVTGTIKLYV